MRLRYLVSVSALAVTLGAGAQAFAADGAQSTTLETVVITSQKRTEKLEDVAVAASVVSSNDLAKNNVSDISDLNNLVPSVQLNGTLNGRVPMAIRGVSSNAPEGAVGTPSGVLIAIDGIPVPSDAFGANQLEDVSNVEVLKGPQSTLGGRTAAQGVINVITHSPTASFRDGVNATVTGDGEFRVNGFVSGPISDQLRFSLAGWAATVPYPVKNVYNGGDKYTSQDFSGLRGKLFYQFNENLDATLAVRASQTKSDGFNFVYTYIQPNAALFGLPPLSASVILPGIKANMSNLTNDTIASSGAKVSDFDTSLIVNYHLGANTLTSTTSLLDERSSNIQDLFATSVYEYNTFYNTLFAGACAHGAPIPFCGFPTTWNNTQQLDYHIQQETEELKLVSPADQKLSYVLGAFFSGTRSTLDGYRGLVMALSADKVTPTSLSSAVYGRSTYKVTDDVSLITGLRVNVDTIKLGYYQQYDGTIFGGTPAVAATLTQPATQNISTSASSTQTTVVGDVALQKKLTANSMVYASYSRGYSPEVYNTNLALTQQNMVETPVKEEMIDSFEIGSKGLYLEHRLMINADIFYTKYNNYQIKQIVANGATDPPTDLTNGDATTQGVEIDTAYQVSQNLKVTADASFIDAKFTKYNNAPCYVASPEPATCTAITGTTTYVTNLSGTTLPNSPKFKMVVGAEDRIPFDSTPYTLVLGGTYSYRAKAQMLADGNPQGMQGAYGLLNLRVGIEDAKHHATLTLFADNVLAKTYYTDIEDFWGSPWGANAVVGQPGRDSKGVFGLKLNASF